ncbi:MAG: hypothetical protein IT470_07525 [Pseudomonadales bacterium]|nr:hypothetical protein [Pseudomonadales bacterium]
MKYLWSSVLLVLLAGVSACSSRNDVFTPETLTGNESVLYLYRPKASTPGLAKPLLLSYPEVFIDGRSMGVIPYNRRLALKLQPGQHELRLTGLTAQARGWEAHDIRRKITLPAGEASYLRLRVEYDLSRMNLGQPKAQYSIMLTPVREDDAVYEIRHVPAAR